MTTETTKPKCHGCGKKIGIGLAVVVAALAAFIQLQPSEYHIERSQVMKVAPGSVFGNVNDLHKWEAWSPFVKMDPESTAEYSGPDSGVDASMHWKGEKTGEGTMTVVESKPGELIKFRLDFDKPMKGTSTATFTFTPVEGGTNVTWSMDGHNGFVGKAMSLVMNCEEMMGPTFEDGLKSLKQIAEAE
jgi:uncharacterized protein YndB with AHSA1/START domain